MHVPGDNHNTHPENPAFDPAPVIEVIEESVCVSSSTIFVHVMGGKKEVDSPGGYLQYL